jgi:hypothetical protein
MFIGPHPISSASQNGLRDTSPRTVSLIRGSLVGRWTACFHFVIDGTNLQRANEPDLDSPRHCVQRLLAGAWLDTRRRVVAEATGELALSCTQLHLVR